MTRHESGSPQADDRTCAHDPSGCPGASEIVSTILWSEVHSMVTCRPCPRRRSPPVLRRRRGRPAGAADSGHEVVVLDPGVSADQLVAVAVQEDVAASPSGRGPRCGAADALGTTSWCSGSRRVARSSPHDPGTKVPEGARPTDVRRSADLEPDKDFPRGPDGVPGEGALRQARRHDHPRHRRRPPPRRPGRRRGARRRASSRRRSRPAAAARPAASSWPRRPTRPSSTRRTILGMQIKGLTVNRVLIAPAAPPRRSTTSPSCSTAPTGSTSASPASRAAWRSRRSPRPTPTPSSRSRSTRAPASTRRRPARSSTEAKFPERAGRPGRGHGAGAVEGLRRGGRHAGRGQPAGPARGRQARGARRQGLARRERRVPARGPRGVRDQGRDRPARGEGQGEGAQLRQARRRRSASSATARGWSCRPSTWSRTPARSTAA